MTSGAAVTAACANCGTALGGSSRSGRPARYCSNTCRQRAYRSRSRATAEPGNPGPAAPAETGNLPAALDEFVGRTGELDQVRALLDDHRLVTVTGPGGIGKTRLALELGGRVEATYPDGVWLVELASLTDPAQLTHAVAAAALGVSARRGGLDALVHALAGQQRLVILDNCEHLVESAARLAEELLRRCPALRVVATSREPLDCHGEAVLRLGELSVPHADSPTLAGPQHLLRYDAVRLFVLRSQAVVPAFTLTPDNAGHVAAICRRLDGVPLAIELAAQRVRMLPVAEIHARLDDRFRFLTAGRRRAESRRDDPRAEDRHNDLHSAIAWSEALLQPAEQAVFRRLSVLAGGFDLAAATEVCADHVLVPRSAMIDLLTRLEAKSLITRGTGTHRFRQLESIRLFARDRLLAHGEEEATFARMVDWLTAGLDEVLDRTEEPANYAAAHDWAVLRGDPREVLLAAGLAQSWSSGRQISEGRELLRATLRRAPADNPHRAIALAVACRLAVLHGDEAEASELADQAIALDEQPRQARALLLHSLKAVLRDDLETARDLARTRLDLLDRPDQLAGALAFLALIEARLGDVDRATSLAERFRRLRETHRLTPSPATIRDLGFTAVLCGDWTLAEQHFHEILRRPLDLYSALGAVAGLALVAARAGDLRRARRLRTAAEAQLRAHRLAAHLPAALSAALDQIAEAGEVPPELTVAQVVAYALDDIWPGGSSGSPLSEDEERLVGLVADGLTDRAIAARLFLSERTVRSHLNGLRARLGLRSRVQLAAWYAERAGLSRARSA